MRDDETKNWHNYLIIPMSAEDFGALKARFMAQTPKLGSTAVVRGGKPFIIFEYGGALDLSEQFGSGETLGDKLAAGDIVTVILTDQTQPFTSSEEGVKINFNLEDVIAYPFTYTREMEQTYEFYVHYTKVKGSEGPIELKKSKHLFR